MLSTRFFGGGIAAAILALFALPAAAQSFRVQCPSGTPTHSVASEAALGAADNPVGGRIKCQQISGGDGFATMGDGTQTYLFSFGPLSGLANIANGLPGTEPPSIFNTVGPNLQPGDPATTGLG